MNELLVENQLTRGPWRVSGPRATVPPAALSWSGISDAPDIAQPLPRHVRGWRRNKQ